MGVSYSLNLIVLSNQDYYFFPPPPFLGGILVHYSYSCEGLPGVGYMIPSSFKVSHFLSYSHLISSIAL